MLAQMAFVGIAHAQNAAVEPCELAGSLSASASTASVTGTARAVIVPAGNGGGLRLSNLVIISGTPQYKKNADAFAEITEGLEVTFADTDTLQVQGVIMTSATQITFDVIDVATGSLVQSVVIERT